MSVVVLTLMLVIGVAILYFYALPDKGQRISLAAFASTSRRDTSLGARLEAMLRSAGMFYQAPSLFVLSLLVITAVVATLLVLLTGVVYSVIAAPILVFFATQVYIIQRQRSHTNKAIQELIPFLSRISAAVKSGQNIQQAYLGSLAESPYLSDILGESAAKIQASAPFVPTLLETIPLLPLRMWSQFVRQVEVNVDMGGDMAENLDRTVTQINQMLQLQAEARADYAIQVWQQRLILIILVGSIVAFNLLIGTDRFMILFTTLPGVISLMLGLVVIAFGLWGLNRQIRDIERKLSF